MTAGVDRRELFSRSRLVHVKGVSVNQIIPHHLSDYCRQSRIALAIAGVTDDHALLTVNAPFEALTGYSAAEVVGQNCRLFQRDAPNVEARERIHEFLGSDRHVNVRTSIVNFRKDGRPFVNLLYMSKLRTGDGAIPFIFASQFDVSHAQPELLADYDRELGMTLSRLTPLVAEAGMVLEGSLMTIGNTAATIAQAKLTLAELDDVRFP